jgi:hypothetical protein
MAKEIEPVVFSDEEIVQFITKYVAEYRRLADACEVDLKKELKLYTGYPYKITVLTSEKGTHVKYQLNAKNFEIEIKRVKETPKLENKAGYLVDAYANIFLKRIINQPELKARRDIDDETAYEEHQTEENERAEIEWAKYEQERFDDVVDGYDSYTKKAYIVQEKTFSDKRPELYHIIQFIHNQHIVLEVYLHLGCLTLFDTLEETMSDLESSTFLAVHGKYEPALGLLRRYLETTLCSLFYDAELFSLKPTSKSYAALNSRKEKWLEKSFHMRFTGPDSVLDKLLDADTDYSAIETVKSTTIPTFSYSSFQSYIESIYHHLSKYVHYGGKRDWAEILRIDFQEFREERFKEWNSSFHQVVEICNLLILLKFPKLPEIYSQIQEKKSGEVPLLDEKQIRAVKNLTV